jgi:hypothetical protein
LIAPSLTCIFRFITMSELRQICLLAYGVVVDDLIDFVERIRGRPLSN